MDVNQDVTSPYRERITHPFVDVTVLLRRDSEGGYVVLRVLLNYNNRDEMDHIPFLPEHFLEERIHRYLDGERVDFSDVSIHTVECTPFQRDVLRAAVTIPRGSTISYSELARRAGHPHAVRAAATVMRKNRFPILIPCHRVIRGTGLVGSFMGTKSGNAPALKQRLLELEGCRLKKNTSGVFDPRVLRMETGLRNEHFPANPGFSQS